MYFDDITLTAEAAQTYSYDSNGNLEKTTDIDGNDSLMTYTNGIDLDTYTSPTGEAYDYTYDEDGANPHRLLDAKRTANSVTQTLTYGYNTFGQVTSTVLTATGTTERITSSVTYSADGNYATSVTDSLGNTTSYSYNSEGKVSGYNGHHMKSVSEYPDLAGDPTNIQFLTRKEHLAAHNGNWRNPTHGIYIC